MNDEQNQNGYPLPPTPPHPEPPPYPYPPHAPYAPPVGKGYAVASMVIGIVSVCFSWTIILGFAFAIMSIVGIALSISSKKRCYEAGLAPYGMGTAGLVLNIIGLVLNALGFLGCAVCVPLMLVGGF